MEDTSIEAISADTGKPKKQLPKNFRSSSSLQRLSFLSLPDT